MTDDTGNPAAAPVRSGPRWSDVALIVLVTVLVTGGLSYWLLNHYLFLKAFTPVELGAREERVLNGKLRAIGFDVQAGAAAAEPLEPEPYSEEGARREVEFSERELNAMLAKNTNLASRFAIDLSDDLVSAKLLVPMEQDFPVLGGKTLRVTAGLGLAYDAGKPVVVLKGVSVMGVPIPNAWLGNLKNVDLVREFGAEAGFWQSFAAGIDHVRVQEGELTVKLKE